MTCSITVLRPGLFRKYFFCGLVAAGVFVLDVACASEAHEAEKLQLNDALTLSALLTITLDRHPQAGVLAARAATVDAEKQYASRWLPDTTGLAAFHMSDRAFDDAGAYENEVALSFPMWLPGEKKAQTRLGEMLTTSQASDETEFRWRVSGHLRQQLWQLKLAVRQWELALEQEQRLAEVLAQVTLFAEAGELSRADQLATMEELAIWKGETLLLEAEYMDAMRLYRSFTGMETVPAQIEEMPSELQEIGQEHPALRQAMDHLAESSASTDVIRERSNLRPSLDVFWRGFRGDERSPAINALGVGFAIPLGQSPRRKPEVAKAFEEVALAQAGLLETRRALELQLHEAEHVLHTTRARLENSATVMQAATERHQLDKLAYELGEFSTREWLRRLSRFREIESSHEFLLIQQGAAIAAYNQAVGESL
jgi:cobalt-zinc-cadmium efflux system outer membrane protein